MTKLNYRIVRSNRRRDHRGYLVDFLKADELDQNDKLFGQMYYVTFEAPGAVRGNHYHKTKKEWFVIARGKVKVILEDIKTKKRETFVLDGKHDDYVRLEIGPGVAHAFTNLTKNAVMINYCNKPYYHPDPDSDLYVLIETDHRLIKKNNRQKKNG